MKRMNSLAVRLFSWQPRRPAAGLKRRLFGTPVKLVPKMAWFVGWLVPATACALLTFFVLTSGNELRRSSRHGLLMATGLSNQSYLVSVPDTLRQGQNHLSSVTFELTNRNGSTSSITAFPRRRVN
jgi:hypothetical protein